MDNKYKWSMWALRNIAVFICNDKRNTKISNTSHCIADGLRGVVNDHIYIH